ncbi:MAG TPA: hypothetical protein VGF99_10935, partial [Myxococcota bacterium]
AVVAEAPVVVPVAPPAPAAPPAPVAEPELDDGPKKKASRRKPKKGEELIPPPSRATLAAIEAGPAAVDNVVESVVESAVESVVEAPAAPAPVEAEASTSEEAPKGRRRAPPLDEPVRVRAPLDDGPRGGGPPRGRPRRGPSMVEVVRVSKKT